MTSPARPELLAGTLADLRTLMQEPVWPRRGSTYLVPLPAPAAGAGLTYKVDSAWWERIVSLLFTFTAAAGGNPRSVSVNMANADGTAFNLTPALAAVQGGEVWQVSADLAGTAGVGGQSSLGNSGTVTAPAAGGTITSVAAGPGEWQVQWNVSLAGTPGAGEVNNFEVIVGSTVYARSDNPGAVGGPFIQAPVNVLIPAGGATIAVKAIGIGTAGAVYDASMSATPVGSLVSFPQLPNIVLKSGWQLLVAVAGIQAGDQISGVQLLTERYPSNWADGSLERDLGLEWHPGHW